MKFRPACYFLIPPIAAALLAFPGCVSRQSALLKTEVQDLQNRIYELQKRNAEAQVEIQELSERAGASSSSVSGGGEASSAPPPIESVRPPSEPEVPGSTIDLGESGPSRNLDHAPEGSRVLPAQSIPGGGTFEASPADSAAAPGGEEADKLYTQGYAQFNSGDHAAAEQAFQEFLARAPESDLADDAQYWIGECFFSRKDYRRAILEFRKVIDQYPFGNRVPHAFLKLGLSYLALGDRDRAAENLETVVQAFPRSDVATVARATLDEIAKPQHLITH